MTGEAAVVVVGDLMVDVVASPHGPLAHGSDTPASVTTGGGGSAANTAAWLAQAGSPVRLVAAVGDDLLGAVAVRDLTAAGVAVVGPTLAGVTTGTCVVLVDPRGERTMLPDRGANDALTASAVVEALVSPTTWLHLSGYTLLGEGSRGAGLAAVATAREAGLRWSVDASSAAPLTALGPSDFLGWVEGATVLFANDDEIAALGGMASLVDRVEVVVAKHGAGGASWHAASGSWAVPAEPAVVVDTIGAGDALDAGVVAALATGREPEACLRGGVALAAQAVTTRGGRPPHPHGGS